MPAPSSTSAPPQQETSSLLSTRPVPRQERLIFALDLPDAGTARRLAEELGDAVRFYKLGIELAMADGYFALIDWLVGRGKRVFADLKFFDIPETVRGAVRRLRERPVTFATVHFHDRILEAACRAKGNMQILAVTVLTSFDRGDLRALGVESEVAPLVVARARRAVELGCDGVVASGLEAAVLRTALGPAPLIVTPGIRPRRPPADRPADDQKRIVSVEDAFHGGADYIVVGRPIRNAPDPRQAALAIQRTIADLFP